MASPACLSSLVGLWVLGFLRFQVLPLDPFHPAQQIRFNVSQIRKIVMLQKELQKVLVVNCFLLSVQAFLGNPSHPEDKEQYMKCSIYFMYYSTHAFNCSNASTKHCPPCRLLLHSHPDHLENPCEAD